jgi:ATP-binding protein involved in chromosome partitioning
MTVFLKKKVTEQDIKACLKTIMVSDVGKTLLDSGYVSSIQLNDGKVLLVLEVDPDKGTAMEDLRLSAEDSLRRIKGVKSAMVVMTARADGQNTAGKRIPVKSQSVTGKKIPARAPQPLGRDLNIKHIIAVASGKGGVGKSTVAANLALGFAKQGLKTGLMDADVYGPSIPRMMGVKDHKPEAIDGKLEVVEAHGLKLMSMGFMVEEQTPMIWRGPMIQSALRQFLEDVHWGELDVLVVDLPPGTGDAQLTMAQKVPLSGAVIVSTPQDIALIDARKGLAMFEKVGIPVLGMIENMSQFVCPNCDHETHIFGHGGAREEAKKLGCSFLGEIPLDISVREQSDAGTPIIVSHPDSAAAKVFLDVSEKVWDSLKDTEAPSEPAVKVKKP